MIVCMDVRCTMYMYINMYKTPHNYTNGTVCKVATYVIIPVLLITYTYVLSFGIINTFTDSNPVIQSLPSIILILQWYNPNLLSY